MESQSLPESEGIVWEQNQGKLQMSDQEAAPGRYK